MDLASWLSYIENLPYHSDPQFNFQQSKELARRLDLKKYPGYAIAVTGTNGKGSIVYAIEKYCCLNNITCGLLTSPHLRRFHERIRLNGEEVKDNELINAFNEIKQHSDGLSLHFFHYAYFAGLLLFKQKNLQVIILEVGMGGRFDPINTIDNDLTIIANVDYDHCDFLGDSLEEIALEKAQLIRTNKPTIFGAETCPEAIQQVAKERSSSLYQLGRDFSYSVDKEQWNMHIHHSERICKLPIPNIILNNAATAMMACHLLSKNLRLEMTLDYKKLWQGFSIPGRMQFIEAKGRKWLLDVAHNPQAAQHLSDELMKIRSKYKRILTLFAVGKKKDTTGMLFPMLKIMDKWFITALPNKRMNNMEELQQIFRQFPANCYYYLDVKQALQDIVDQSNGDDLIVVWGSFLMVSALLNEIGD